jgi:hypothetical protein
MRQKLTSSRANAELFSALGTICKFSDHFEANYTSAYNQDRLSILHLLIITVDTFNSFPEIVVFFIFYGI